MAKDLTATRWGGRSLPSPLSLPMTNSPPGTATITGQSGQSANSPAAVPIPSAVGGTMAGSVGGSAGATAGSSGAAADGLTAASTAASGATGSSNSLATNPASPLAVAMENQFAPSALPSTCTSVPLAMRSIRFADGLGPSRTFMSLRAM